MNEQHWCYKGSRAKIRMWQCKSDKLSFLELEVWMCVWILHFTLNLAGIYQIVVIKHYIVHAKTMQSKFVGASL